VALFIIVEAEQAVRVIGGLSIAYQPQMRRQTMSNTLTGKTITITTRKNMNVEEMIELIRTSFGKTQCPTCTSGGYLVLREEAELSVEPALKARVTLS
jgi:hypothetical protein